MVLKIAKFFFKASVAVGLIYWLLRKIDYEVLIIMSREMNVFYLFGPLLLWFVALYFGNLRWILFINDEGVGIKPAFLFTLSWISVFFSNFLPSNIGGDTYKFGVLKKYKNMKSTQILLSLLLDRGIGLYGMMLSALILSFPLIKKLKNAVPVLSRIDNWVVFAIYGVLILLAFLILYFLMSSRVYSFSDRFTNEFLVKISRMLETLFSCHDSKRILLALLYTIIILVLSSLSFFFQFKAYHIEVNLLHIIIMLPLISVVELVPLSINAIGIKEGAGVFLFGLYGYSPEAILAVFVLNRILALLISSTGGIIYIFFKQNH